jgi:hypothetical protein
MVETVAGAEDFPLFDVFLTKHSRAAVWILCYGSVETYLM